MKLIKVVTLSTVLFYSSVYAQSPSIEATQKYIIDVMKDRTKSNPTKLKLNFSGKCIGELSHPKYFSIKFDLINKHKLTTSLNSDATGYLGVGSYRKAADVIVSRLDKNKKTEYWPAYSFGVTGENIFHGMYNDKIKKAFEHLNAECRKKYIDKGPKELF